MCSQKSDEKRSWKTWIVAIRTKIIGHLLLQLVYASTCKTDHCVLVLKTPRCIGKYVQTPATVVPESTAWLKVLKLSSLRINYHRWIMALRGNYREFWGECTDTSLPDIPPQGGTRRYWWDLLKSWSFGISHDDSNIQHAWYYNEHNSKPLWN